MPVSVQQLADKSFELLKANPRHPVALAHDLPEKGLRAGDLGAVVEVYQPDGLDVEFVTASGLTEALVTF